MSSAAELVLPAATSEQVLFDEDFGAEELPLFLRGRKP